MTRSALALALLLAPAGVGARPWPPRATARVARHAETIRVAAETYGVAPALLAAVCVHESGLRPVRGGLGAGMWGPCQVAWSVWSDELQAEGIALAPEDLLEPDLIAGLLAGAYVLARIRALYPGAEEWRLLCLYASGVVALGWSEGCAYSAAVLRGVRRARVALAAGEAVRGWCGGEKGEEP